MLKKKGSPTITDRLANIDLGPVIQTNNLVCKRGVAFLKALYAKTLQCFAEKFEEILHEKLLTFFSAKVFALT